MTVQSYQYSWRLSFASQHLSNAGAFTDAESQSVEIAKAIEILDAFPKEGNYAFWNKQNPRTDLGAAWKSLHELKAYADEIKKLDKSSPQYQVGIYNIQEKISYFFGNFYGAFTEYEEWGVAGWLAGPTIVCGVIWMIATIMLSIVVTVNRSSLTPVVANFVIMIAAGAIFLWIYLSPVFYTGPV
jgi:hypothetical protein